jgi:hypothetical protein
MTVARARVIWVIAPYADWPQWLKAVVMVPDCILIGIAMVAEDTRGLAQTRIRASVLDRLPGCDDLCVPHAMNYFRNAPFS